MRRGRAQGATISSTGRKGTQKATMTTPSRLLLQQRQTSSEAARRPSRWQRLLAPTALGITRLLTGTITPASLQTAGSAVVAGAPTSACRKSNSTKADAEVCVRRTRNAWRGIEPHESLLSFCSLHFYYHRVEAIVL